MKLSDVAWAVAGGATWTASEYLIHRFIGHGKPRQEPKSLLHRLTPGGFVAAFNVEHRAHHTDPTYFAPTSQKVAASAIIIPAVTALMSPFIGFRRAGAYALGFTAVYGAYEFVHRRVHTHAPLTAYGRWMRRHHLDHHHRTPKANHGVTSPAWDYVFQTHFPATRVKIPRVAAPVWMTDPVSGEIRPEHAADYELVGPRKDAKPATAAAQAMVS